MLGSAYESNGSWQGRGSLSLSALFFDQKYHRSETECHSQTALFIACGNYFPVMYLRLVCTWFGEQSLVAVTESLLGV